MKSMARYSSPLVVALILVTKVLSQDVDAGMKYESNEVAEQSELVTQYDYIAHEEYIRHIHSIMDAYRSGGDGERMTVETNALIDTKFKTWKRNADLINSLLALPKDMNDAGR